MLGFHVSEDSDIPDHKTADHKIQHWVTPGHWEVHPAQQRVNFPMAIASSSLSRSCVFAGFDLRGGGV